MGNFEEKLGAAHGASCAAAQPEEKPHRKEEAQICETCIILVFLFCSDHDARAVSRPFRDALDIARPVVVLGPPQLPTKAILREPIGSSRVRYGEWRYSFRSISITTSVKSAGKRVRRWEQTRTSADVSYAESLLYEMQTDADASFNFWRAALSELRRHEHARNNLNTRPSNQNGTSNQGASLSLKLGSGAEVRIDNLRPEMVSWAAKLETLAQCQTTGK